MTLTESQKQTLMAMGLLAIMIGGGVWYYQMMFGSTSMQVQKERIEESEAKIAELEVRKKEYRDLKAREPEILALEDKVRAAAARLPREPQENQFHQILTNIMARTGVYPIRVDPIGQVKREFYIEIPFKLECFAKYHHLGELFNMFEENQDRLMRIRAFMVTNEEEAPEERPSVHYGEVEIASYAFKPSSRKR